MIGQLTIENFKCLTKAELSFSNLTLLLGKNSSGKSSVLQSLLLFFDNLKNKDAMNGKAKALSITTKSSKFNEMRNFVNNAKSFSLEMSDDNDAFVAMTFTPADDSLIETDVNIKEKAEGDNNKLAKHKLYYLPATRISNQDSYPIGADNQLPLGAKGELVVQYFYNHRYDIIAENLIAPNSSSRTLEGQVNFWLKKLTGYSISITIEGNDFIVRFVDATGHSLRPYHIGTGVSYIAQILIVGLCISMGNLMLIENPEIHLHPNAQADMIDFLVMISKAGSQCVVETHSDHFFNGIRRLIANQQVEREQVEVYFFAQNHEELTCYPTRIGFTAEGAPENGTPDAFDQFDKDLDAILHL